MTDLERAELKLELTEALADCLEQLAEADKLSVATSNIAHEAKLLEQRLSQLWRADRLRFSAEKLAKEIKDTKLDDAWRASLVEGI